MNGTSWLSLSGTTLIFPQDRAHLLIFCRDYFGAIWKEYCLLEWTLQALDGERGPAPGENPDSPTEAL